MSYQAYEAARDSGRTFVEGGDVAQALIHYSHSRELAVSLEDQRLIEVATCNVAAMQIELGETSAVLAPLRAVLMRNADGEAARLAAYYVARAYEKRGELDKALFYARIARDRSKTLERTAWVASSHIHMGNLLLFKSEFDQAALEYGAAIALLSDDDDLRLAASLDSLGYCHFVQGEFAMGFGSVFRSLRMFRRLENVAAAREPHLSLAFGYLEVGKFRQALRHAGRALRLADEAGDERGSKNALYLLGEAANLLGDRDEAEEVFSELQRRFYPDTPFVADFLLAVDVRNLVHLKA